MSLTVLGFMGESESGKSLCAKWLVDNQGFQCIGFTDVFKEFCADVFGFSKEQLWGDPKYRNRKVIPCSSGLTDAKDAYLHWHRARMNFNSMVHTWLQKLGLSTLEKAEYLHVLERWIEECETRAESGPVSPRLVLQLLGTEYGNQYKRDIWFNYLYEQRLPEFEDGSKIAIVDTRFLWEVKAIQDNGGHVIKLIRTAYANMKNEAEEAGIGGHPTEVDQRYIPEEEFDLVLHLEEGVEKVHTRLREMWERKEWLEPAVT
jgi:hypothetical protein